MSARQCHLDLRKETLPDELQGSLNADSLTFQMLAQGSKKAQPHLLVEHVKCALIRTPNEHLGMRGNHINHRNCRFRHAYIHSLPVWVCGHTRVEVCR